MHNSGGNTGGFLIFYGASRSRKINYKGTLRDYLATLGLQSLQVRDRDATPEDVVRTLAKKRKRYSTGGESIELSLEPKPTSQSSVVAYDIVRTVKRRSVPQGSNSIGQATLLLASGRFTVESSDRMVDGLPDAATIHEFCRSLHEDFHEAPHTINPSSAAWMARKVLEYVGGVALVVRDRAGTAWWLPEEGVEQARAYFDGLGWEFLAIPVVMNEALAAAIETGRKHRKGAA